MFERLHTPDDVFNFKLGAALTMEQKVLGMLDDLEQSTQREDLKELFRHHAQETRGQIENIERCFHLLGEEVDDSPCPAIEGIDKEGHAMIKKADDSVVDSVVTSAAIETEHHEIAAYENLITAAESHGRQEIAGLLRQNLTQEQHALEGARQASERILASSGVVS